MEQIPCPTDADLPQDLKNTTWLQNQTFPTKAMCFEMCTPRPAHHTVDIVVGSVAGVGIAVAGLVLAFRRRRRQSGAPRVAGVAEEPLLDPMALDGTEFSMADIGRATQNFADSNKLGEGAFGTVYRGELPSLGVVAIKILSRKCLERGATENGSPLRAADGFRREAHMLRQYRHPNIVPLLGHCFDGRGERPCLVCQFMEGGSLQDRLAPHIIERRGAMPTELLLAGHRFKIASDIARGLAYLHRNADPSIVHQDVKPDNILLSAAPSPLVAKLADFGIARIAPEQHSSHVTTMTRSGTPAFIPPELIMAGQVSTRTDSYAFGTVLLMLLTGRPPYDPASRVPLTNDMDQILEDPEQSLEQHLDPAAGDWPLDRAEAMSQIAHRCIEHRPRKRCEVYDIVDELDCLVAGRGKPAFSSGSKSVHHDRNRNNRNKKRMRWLPKSKSKSKFNSNQSKSKPTMKQK